MSSTESVTREGARAGIFGALAVAVWFFFVDLIAGQPLATPEALGAALVSVLRANQQLTSLTHLIVYTVFHFAVFIILGIIAAAVIRASDREPSILMGFLFLFVVMEVGAVGYIYVLSKGSSLGNLAWYQVGAANLLSAFVMGRVLLRGHPEVVHRVDEALRGM
jgi:hypothetical protein